MFGFSSKEEVREERRALMAELDRAYTNGGSLQLDDTVYDLRTREGRQAYEEAADRVGELAIVYQSL